MADIDALKTELTAGHPDTGAYDADDAAAAVEINVVNRTTNKLVLTGSEVYNAIVPSAYTGLSATDKSEVWNILHLGELNPFGLEATRFVSIFGAASATITALKALRIDDVSRAVELNLGKVRAGEVAEARA